MKQSGANILAVSVSVHVDDLFVTGNNEALLKEFKTRKMKAFEMTDLGLMAYFLGMEVQQNEDGVTITQKK